jgi:hypothetical protein
VPICYNRCKNGEVYVAGVEGTEPGIVMK